MTRLIEIIQRNKYFLIFTIILLTIYITMLYKISDVNLYNFNFYVLTYKYGFISRGFVGTVFDLLFKIVTIKKVYLVLNLVYIAIILFIAYLFQYIALKVKDKNNALIIILLCIFNPASFMLMITMNEFGRFDILIFLLSIIILIMIYKNKGILMIPILFIIAMLIHQNFLFMYAPLLLVIMIYNWLKKKERKWLIVLCLSLIALLGTFASLQKYGKVEQYKTAEEFASVLVKSTDIPFPTYEFSSLDAEYYRGIDEHINLTIPRLLNTPKIYFVIGFILLISYICTQYILCYRYIFSRKKYQMILLLLSCFGSIPLFAIGVDFGRWYIAIIGALTLLFIYLVADNIDSINCNDKKSSKSQLVVFTLVVFYALVMQTTPFTFMEFTEISQSIEKIQDFINFLI